LAHAQRRLHLHSLAAAEQLPPQLRMSRTRHAPLRAIRTRVGPRVALNAPPPLASLRLSCHPQAPLLLLRAAMAPRAAPAAAASITTERGFRLEQRADGTLLASVPDTSDAWRAEGFISVAYGVFISSYLLWPLAIAAACWCITWTPALKAAVGTAAVLYALSFFDGSERRTGRPMPRLRRHACWLLSWRYCGMRVLRTQPLDASAGQQYIFPMSPHGILLLSRLCQYAGAWELLFPGIDTRVLAASPMFRLPIVRELCLALGAVDASRRTATTVLRKGLSVIVYPGGSREIFTTDATAPDRVFLSERKGFISLALSSGAALVPTYVYNEKCCFKRILIHRAVTDWVLKRLKIPLIIFYGRWCTLLPFRPACEARSLLIVYGAPIPVARVEAPTPEQVDELHARYVAALRALYNAHRAEAGYGAQEELIID
jgi:hypothetical protein